MAQQRNFTNSEVFFKSMVTYTEAYNCIPTILSMIVNIFHVFVLSRKTIASSAVNCVLLGIGIVDILSPVIYIKIAIDGMLENKKWCPDLLPLNNELRYPYKIVEITDSPVSGFNGTARLIHLVLTAVFEKIIPSIVFPISAILLIMELRVKKKTGKFYKQADTTNQLVIYMTITFIIIELPIGICKLITATRNIYEDADLVAFADAYNYIPAVLSMIINMFHVFILSRKTIPSSAVNCILLGIGIVDFLSPLIYIKTAITGFLDDKECPLPPSQIDVILAWVFSAIRDNFRRCSVWLGLCMAIIRTISLKMATNKAFDFINTSKTGRFSIFFVVLISSTFSICYVFRYRVGQSSIPWVPAESCSDLIELDVIPTFGYKIVEMSSTDSVFLGSARMIHLYLTAVFGKIIPSILFPISTLVLVLELRKTKKIMMTSRRQTDKTNLLVVYMTITFIIIELPIGVCNLITATRKGYDDAIIPESISKLLNIVYVSVTATHCFICFVMSSQYRKTVKSVLGLSKKVFKIQIFSRYSDSINNNMNNNK